MAVLDDILAGQQADKNQALALAAHGASWANFFNSTPPVEKLRANLNLTDMVDTAVRRKQDLMAQTDLKAAQLREANARHDEFIKQAPLREDLLRARVDATGAAERRRAVESRMEMDQTANLHNGVLKLYQAGAKKGSPEFQQGLIDILAANPHATTSHLADLGKLAGIPDTVDPAAFAAEGVAMKEAARTAGIKNPRLRNAGGKWVVDESADVVTPEQKTADAVARANALRAARPPEPLTPKQAGFLGRYDAPVAALSAAKPILEKAGVDVNAQWNGADSEIDKAVVAGKITKEEAATAAKAIDKFRKASGKQEDYQSHFDEVAAEVGALKKTAPAASAAAKTLDAGAAKALLQEAKGDKDAARALAKERGFQF